MWYKQDIVHFSNLTKWIYFDIQFFLLLQGWITTLLHIILRVGGMDIGLSQKGNGDMNRKKFFHLAVTAIYFHFLGKSKLYAQNVTSDVYTLWVTRNFPGTPMFFQCSRKCDFIAYSFLNSMFCLMRLGLSLCRDTLLSSLFSFPLFVRYAKIPSN